MYSLSNRATSTSIVFGAGFPASGEINTSFSGALGIGLPSKSRLCLRCNVTIVIPKPDYRPGKRVLITERAQARGVYREMVAQTTGSKVEPPRSEHPNEMSAGEKKDIAVDCPNTLDHAVGTLSDLCWPILLPDIRPGKVASPDALPLSRSRAVFRIRRSSTPRGQDPFRPPRQNPPVRRFARLSAKGW